MFRPHRHLDGPSLIEARNLTVGYRGVPVLPSLDFRLQSSEFWALIGRNGSGKTTLIRTLIGLLPPVAGAVDHAPGVRIGYVPQRSEIDPHLPGRSLDVVLGGRDTGWSFLDPRRLFSNRAEALARVAEELDITPLLRMQFTELSEGQKQRVLMARALISDPGVLVLDEPTSAMDVVAERSTFRLIDRIRTERRLGIIVVSHHLAIVAAHATDVLFVDREDNVALAGCIADIAREPAFTRRFSAFDCGLAPHDHSHDHSHDPPSAAVPHA